MDHNIRIAGVLAWTVLGLVIGFVVYSVLSLYLLSILAIALAAGAFSAVLTIILYKEQESDNDKFFVGLCALSIAGLASGAKFFKYYAPVEFSISGLVIGILIGILVSMILVVYLIDD